MNTESQPKWYNGPSACVAFLILGVTGLFYGIRGVELAQFQIDQHTKELRKAENEKMERDASISTWIAYQIVTSDDPKKKAEEFGPFPLVTFPNRM